jgi:hypothetical protein
MTQARSVTATFAKLLPACGRLTPSSVRATKQGRVSFAVRNPNAARLAGSVKLRVTRGQLGLKTRRSVKVTIGQARFRAAGNGRARITLRLTAPARSYLGRHPRLVATVSVTLGGRTCPARLTIKRPA